jgi:single-stranded-DNA-specific exonuclease
MTRAKRWKILPRAPSQQFAAFPNLSPLMVQVLYNRGLRGVEEADAFLSAGRLLVGDPFCLADMERAVERIARALVEKETVAVYGDFDVDGLAGAALLSRFLSSQGARVLPYIPHREREGYGLHSAAIEHLRSKGATLLVTVDCGTRAIAEIQYARQLGLDTIVTDHHSLPASQGASPELPPALAVVNPRRSDSSYPFQGLSGVGVVYKLVQALAQALGQAGFNEEDYLDLAALGTIADLVPLVAENRFLARRGLEVLNTCPRVGLRELVRGSGLRLGEVNAHSISYVIGPRLNAAGRLGHAMTSYDLLVTDSPQEAEALAQELERQNSRRQRLTEETLARAREQALRQAERFSLLMVGSRSFAAGIIGLVASKLAEEFYRPVVAVEVGERESRGSARSIPGFDIHDALTRCAGLLTRYGGHAQAAGFTIANENLGPLRQRLLGIAQEELSPQDLEPTLTIDAQVDLAGLDWDMMRFIQRLAPFGTGNPPPTFLSRGVRVVDRRLVGDNHLRLKLHDGRLTWPAVGFGMGEREAEVGSRVDVVYHLVVDRWDGDEILQLAIEDLRPAGSQAVVARSESWEVA